MDSKIINKPSEPDAAMLFSAFGCGNHDIISLSEEDFNNTISGATAAVAIERSASGPDRLKKALNDIKTGIAGLAPALQLSNADKILCLIVAPENFKISEMNHLSEFFNDFSNDANIIWGVANNEVSDTDEVTLRLLVSYL